MNFSLVLCLVEAPPWRQPLVHDVSEYCMSVGSSVFLCSLDVEGAYDGIPHSVLFHCAGSVLPDYVQLVHLFMCQYQME